MFDRIYNDMQVIRHLLANIPRVEISHRQIQDAMYALKPTLAYNLHDPVYSVTTRAMTDMIVTFDWTSRYPYVTHLSDCDKYSRAFKTHLWEMTGITGIGVVTDKSSQHSYVLVGDWYEDRLCLRPLDPQTQKWVQMGSGLYVAEKGDVDW